MNYLPVLNTVLLVVTLIAVVMVCNSIGNKIEFVEMQKVGGAENYKLVQQIYNSDKFREQQKMGIQQSLDQINGAAPTAQPNAAAPSAAQPQELSQEEVAQVINDNVPLRGAENPTIVMIEYSDIECPFCKRLHEDGAYSAVMQKYPNDVASTFKHFPLSFHANAQKQAEAAECVMKEGGAEKYFAFVDELFKRTTSGGQGFALENLAPLAEELGLNKASIQTCIDSGEMASKVAADMQEGQTFGVTGTPGNIILNVKTGKWVSIAGAQGSQAFMNAVDQLMQ